MSALHSDPRGHTTPIDHSQRILPFPPFKRADIVKTLIKNIAKVAFVFIAITFCVVLGYAWAAKISFFAVPLSLYTDLLKFYAIPAVFALFAIAVNAHNDLHLT